jgi:hypothetical protein
VQVIGWHRFPPTERNMPFCITVDNDAKDKVIVNNAEDCKVFTYNLWQKHRQKIVSAVWIAEDQIPEGAFDVREGKVNKR